MRCRCFSRMDGIIFRSGFFCLASWWWIHWQGNSALHGMAYKMDKDTYLGLHGQKTIRHCRGMVWRLCVRVERMQNCNTTDLLCMIHQFSQLSQQITGALRPN